MSWSSIHSASIVYMSFLAPIADASAEHALARLHCTRATKCAHGIRPTTHWRSPGLRLYSHPENQASLKAGRAPPKPQKGKKLDLTAPPCRPSPAPFPPLATSPLHHAPRPTRPAWASSEQLQMRLATLRAPAPSTLAQSTSAQSWTASRPRCTRECHQLALHACANVVSPNVMPECHRCSAVVCSCDTSHCGCTAVPVGISGMLVQEQHQPCICERMGACMPGRIMA